VTPDQTAGGGRSLLVVTDAPAHATAWRRGTWRGFGKTAVVRVDRAVDEIRDTGPDLVVLDATDEATGCWGVLARVKGHPVPAVQRTPVVVFGPPGDIERIRAAIEGAVGYIDDLGEPEAVADALMRALSAPEPALRKAAQRRALEKLAALERRGAGGAPASPAPAPSRPEPAPAPALEEQDWADALEQLSPRQRSTLAALADTTSTADAARRLGVSASRTSAQTRAIAKRLGLAPPELVRLARKGAFESALADTTDRLTAELEAAVGNDELVLDFQPILSIGERRISGAEALLRWRHPRRGLLAPSAFLPEAEEGGSIWRLTDWVLERALGELVRWRSDAGQDDLQLTVNVSAGQAAEARLVETVRRSLDAAGVEGRCLVLDVPASITTGRRGGVIGTFSELRGLGVLMAIDDFGASVPQSVKRLPIDVLKIGPSFIAGLGRTNIDTAIVNTAIQFAAALDVKSHAEGVETQHQLELLTSLGCDLAQGFAVGPPVPPEHLPAFLL
jgi:EAL domain-containing protein (putative c-di-GMP-specific phosphodiesterase class I)/DNA-binding NarL/FixJ family response regulator